MLVSARSAVHVLERARSSDEHPPATWLDDPPAGLVRFRVSCPVAAGSVPRALDALLDWRVHRAAGLRVYADSPAREGSTVVSALPLGPWGLAAPCRVVAVDATPDRAGFAYATLPGHPELGVERFGFERVGDGWEFVVEAVSRPALLASRLAPAVATRVQAHVTRRYLAAARRLGSEPTG